MKHLTIRVYNSKKPPFRVRVWPGLRPGDVCFHLNIFGSVLVPAATAADDLPNEICKNSNTFDEDWYEQVQDGDELIAIPEIEAARIVWAVWADMMSKVPSKETTK
jgi:hypothetical protein